MNCDKFSALSTKEKIEYIGKLSHAVQNSDAMYDIGCEIINLADKRGMYEDVKFGSEIFEEEKPDTLTSETKDY